MPSKAGLGEFFSSATKSWIGTGSDKALVVIFTPLRGQYIAVRPTDGYSKNMQSPYDRTYSAGARVAIASSTRSLPARAEHQHEERRLRQVEVCQQRAYYAEFVADKIKEVSFRRFRLWPADCRFSAEDSAVLAWWSWLLCAVPASRRG